MSRTHVCTEELSEVPDSGQCPGRAPPPPPRRDSALSSSLARPARRRAAARAPPSPMDDVSTRQVRPSRNSQARVKAMQHRIHTYGNVARPIQSNSISVPLDLELRQLAQLIQLLYLLPKPTTKPLINGPILPARRQRGPEAERNAPPPDCDRRALQPGDQLAGACAPRTWRTRRATTRKSLT
jgi:hypothetical protein